MPRADRFYWPSLEELAFTLVNPSVQTFRQAISIDERRCMFRLKKWDDPQTYKHNRFNDAHAEPQDILQVWFAGVHADIGGGYPEKESGLVEISAALDDRRGDQMRAAGQPGHRQPARLGHPAQGQPVSPMSRPISAAICTRRCAARGGCSNTCRSAREYKEWPARQTHFGYYIPDAEPRLIPDGAIIHQSGLHRPHERDAQLPPGEHAGESTSRCRCQRSAGAWCERGGDAADDEA